MRLALCFVAVFTTSMAAHRPFAHSGEYVEDKIDNQVSPLDQYDLSAVIKDLTEAKNWFFGMVEANPKDAENLYKKFKEQETGIMDKLRENRLEEWRNVRRTVSDRKQAYADKPSMGKPWKTNSPNRVSVRVECKLDSTIWTPEGIGVISGIEHTGGGNGSSRSYDNPPIQTDDGCYVVMHVTSPHWDVTSYGHYGLWLTLSQTYRHTKDYILRKIEEDMMVFNRMIDEASREKKSE